MSSPFVKTLPPPVFSPLNTAYNILPLYLPKNTIYTYILPHPCPGACNPVNPLIPREELFKKSTDAKVLPEEVLI